MTTLEYIRGDENGATACMTVDPGDPMFGGHYPGFPVLPGVCLIDLVDQTVHAWRAAGQRVEAASAPQAESAPLIDARVELHVIERCRFLEPVFPGDRVTVELTATRTGSELRCAAKASTPRGPVADISLRYRKGFVK